jgi:regulatory protein
MAKRTPRLLDADGLWAYALRALSGRAHSTGELREKLKRKAARQEDINPVLARLKDCGYLDDRKFAETLATSRQENQGLGKFRVLRELRTRRVAPKLAESAVEKAYRGADESQLIEEYLRRKYRKEKLDEFLSDRKNMASAYRRLRYAGFSSAPAIRVLKRFAEAADALEGLEEGEAAREE